MSDYIKRESRTLIEIADDLNDLVTELNDKIAELIREKMYPTCGARMDDDDKQEE